VPNRIDSVPVLREINLHIPPGQIVLLTGASGSGKSTLLHCINGLATGHYGGIQSGSISVAGRELVGKQLWEISEIVGTVFQNPNTQFFQMNVEDEIVFGLEHAHFDRGQIEKRIAKSLLDADIESLRSRDLFSLSSGQRQRVALASILALEQPLLLLDEPTANLDVAAIAELKDVLVNLKNQGRTILISEHRLWFLRGIVDRVITIQAGQVIYDGYPEKLSDDNFRSRLGLRMWNQLPPEQFKPDSDSSHCAESLKVEQLSGCPVKKKMIINSVSLSVEKGACVAIMGHNGAGKTTLSRIITGLEKQKKGAVYINGLSTKTKDRIGKIVCVAQQADQQLFSDTVLEEVLFNQPDNQDIHRRSDELINIFDLSHLLNRHPHTLSGGEKQRLAIAAALISQPEIIILDEPTSGLDAFHMSRLANEIKELCKKGLSFIVITHDMELAASVCDKILWMENGTVTKTITKTDMYDFFDKLMNNNIERLTV